MIAAAAVVGMLLLAAFNCLTRAVVVVVVRRRGRVSRSDLYITLTGLLSSGRSVGGGSRDFSDFPYSLCPLCGAVCTLAEQRFRWVVDLWEVSFLPYWERRS